MIKISLIVILLLAFISSPLSHIFSMNMENIYVSENNTVNSETKIDHSTHKKNNTSDPCKIKCCYTEKNINIGNSYYDYKKEYLKNKLLYAIHDIQLNTKKVISTYLVKLDSPSNQILIEYLHNKKTNLVGTTILVI